VGLIHLAFFLLISPPSDHRPNRSTGQNNGSNTLSNTTNAGTIVWMAFPQYLGQSTRGQRLVRATSYFTARDNGLDREGHGHAWLNPP
jgi:hypothetical protein